MDGGGVMASRTRFVGMCVGRAHAGGSWGVTVNVRRGGGGAPLIAREGDGTVTRARTLWEGGRGRATGCRVRKLMRASFCDVD